MGKHHHKKHHSEDNHDHHDHKKHHSEDHHGHLDHDHDHEHHHHHESFLMLQAQMGPYPGSSFDGTPAGIATLTFDPNDITIALDVSGVAPGCTASNTNPNGCGVHIHEGTDCTKNAGDHFWNPKVFGKSDPWADIRYSSDGDGVASLMSDPIIMNGGGNGFPLEKNVGRALVIHDAAGGRIACGILKTADPAAISVLGAAAMMVAGRGRVNIPFTLDKMMFFFAFVGLAAVAMLARKLKRRRGYQQLPQDTIEV